MKGQGKDHEGKRSNMTEKEQEKKATIRRRGRLGDEIFL